VDFVEICYICARKTIIKAVKRIINSDEMCRSYNDLNFGVTFFGTQCSAKVLEESGHVRIKYIILTSISLYDH